MLYYPLESFSLGDLTVIKTYLSWINKKISIGLAIQVPYLEIRKYRQKYFIKFVESNVCLIFHQHRLISNNVISYFTFVKSVIHTPTGIAIGSSWKYDFWSEYRNQTVKEQLFCADLKQQNGSALTKKDCVSNHQTVLKFKPEAMHNLFCMAKVKVEYSFEQSVRFYSLKWLCFCLIKNVYFKVNGYSLICINNFGPFWKASLVPKASTFFSFWRRTLFRRYLDCIKAKLNCRKVHHG